AGARGSRHARPPPRPRAGGTAVRRSTTAGRRAPSRGRSGGSRSARRGGRAACTCSRSPRSPRAWARRRSLAETELLPPRPPVDRFQMLDPLHVGARLRELDRLAVGAPAIDVPLPCVVRREHELLAAVLPEEVVE